MRAPSRLVACLALSGLVCTALAQPAPSPRGEEIKLPADSILILYEKAADILSAMPRYYLVAPERYNALMAEIERLNRQIQSREPSPVSSWQATGRVRGTVAELKIVFSFKTDRDAAVVGLGCSRGSPSLTGVTVDGKVPPLTLGPAEGLSIEVEKAGDHKAEVELLIPVREVAGAPSSGTGPPAEMLLGFELDLPRASVTTLDIELPEGVTSPQINDEPLNPLLDFSENGRRVKGPLGPKGKLKVAWKPPRTLSGPVPLLTSTGRITVDVQESEVVTDAELTLRYFGREPQNWELQLPERAVVRLLHPEEQVRLGGPIQGSGSPDGRVTVPLAPSVGEPVTLLVTSRVRRGNGPVPVGPFTVVGVSAQSGVLRVRAGADQRVRCLPYRTGQGAFLPGPHGKVPDEPEGQFPRQVSVFDYTAPVTPSRGEGRDPWFKLELETIQGLLTTTLHHTLRLEDNGPSSWRLKTSLRVAPIRAEVDYLDLDWPAPWHLNVERFDRSGVVRDVKEDLARRVVRLELDGAGLKEFTTELELLPDEGEVRGESIVPVPDFPHPSAIIRLPRPRKGLAHDRGGHLVVIEAPGMTHDLQVRQPPNPDMELVSRSSDRIVWKAERFVSQVAVAWQPYRREVRVNSVADVTVVGDEVRVRQRITLDAPENNRPVPGDVLLRVPAGLKRFRVVSGGKELEEPATRPAPTTDRDRPDDLLVRCSVEPGKAPTDKRSLILDFAGAIPDGEGEPEIGAIPVPLVAVQEATRTQTRVRVWAEDGSVLRPIQGAWEEQPLEIVPERESMTSLVLVSSHNGVPLDLRRESSPAGLASPGIVPERALLQVRVSEGGFQHHRARFLVTRINAPHLDLSFPAPLSSLDLLVTFNGHRLNWKEAPAPSESAMEADKGSNLAGRYVARVILPGEPLTRPGALEVTYQLALGRGGIVSAVRTELHPVTIPGLITGVPTRWQIGLPSNWVPLPLDGDASWRWGRRGWLLAPRPSVDNADLERWFWGEGDARATPAGEEGATVPDHVCWRTSPASLPLYHVPQQGWLLVCSLLVLILGLGPGQAAIGSDRGRGRLSRGVLLVLAVVTAGAGLIWPGMLTVVFYGCQPGLAVLLVIMTVQWLLHERYRRRVVFLPGFRRVRSGSSLARVNRPDASSRPGSARSDEARPPAVPGEGRSSGSGPRPPREPSTVDAPPQS